MLLFTPNPGGQAGGWHCPPLGPPRRGTGASGPGGFGAADATAVPYGRREGRGGPALLWQNLPETLQRFRVAG